MSESTRENAELPIEDRKLDELAGRILQGSGRRLVALVGAPSSGKSEIAEALGARINEEAPGRVAVVAMDGFHYDDAVLDALDLRPRKGAPETFDVGGLRATLARLRANEETWVAVPVFERDEELSRAGAKLIRRETEVVIVEGNYLLLDEDPWTRLLPFDLTVRLDVPEAELRRRLRRRWERYALPEEEIRRKIEENDLPNGRRVMERSREPDMVLAQG